MPAGLWPRVSRAATPCPHAASTPRHGHAPQVWEPLLAGSDALERDERDLHDGTASPVIVLFELGAAEVGLTLQPCCNRTAWAATL